MCLALYKFILPVLVTFFAIEQLGSGYSVRSLKSKLPARVECELSFAHIAIFRHYFDIFLSH